MELSLILIILYMCGTSAVSIMLELKHNDQPFRAQNNLLIRKFIIYQVKADENRIIVNGGRPL